MVTKSSATGRTEKCFGKLFREEDITCKHCHSKVDCEQLTKRAARIPLQTDADDGEAVLLGTMSPDPAEPQEQPETSPADSDPPAVVLVRKMLGVRRNTARETALHLLAENFYTVPELKAAVSKLTGKSGSSLNALIADLRRINVVEIVQRGRQRKYKLTELVQAESPREKESSDVGPAEDDTSD